ncbi:MAG: DUF3800 domain-containing protein [Alphaproteobacteria bacterium]|nr:DUF3800 domain-containing protein [Alphaproteobacteria bacterium]MCK5658418.1 DUF3800 domain-containing protein [Alphaproteobacteria bacterium]
MISISNHILGMSLSQDRIWAQVCGMAPEMAGKRLFMVLQAYIDDSYNADGVFVLAGHISSAESWASFAKEWEKLLPYGTLAPKSNKYHFKMNEMAINKERMSRVQAFYRVIEDHVQCSIACSYNMKDLEKAKNRIFVPGLAIDWGFLNNPFLFAFRALMDMFHTRKEEFIKAIQLDQKVDFYFDNQTEKKFVYKFWDSYMNERPETCRKYFGIVPRFEDDKEFLPLQAADLWAWWVRKWVEEGKPEKMEDCDFGGWKAKRKNHPKIHISFNEDELVTGIIGMMRNMLEPGRIIYDVRFSSLAAQSS